jgi:8-hydroxy-5-deazaflavin:NADPH oxidoreductase
MRISILGAGEMGGALASALRIRSGHTVLVRGSKPGSSSALRLVQDLEIREATDDDVRSSDVVFVAVPTVAIPDAIDYLADYQGVVVSVCVSRAVGRDGAASCAERIAMGLPKAKVVDAFTTVWAPVVQNPGDREPVSVFVCSDHETARIRVSSLAREIGFEPINGGALSNAIYAEAMGMFIVRLALDSRYGTTLAYRVFKTA